MSASLSLLIFNIHSDLVVGVESKIVQYADDTSLVGAVKSPQMRDQVADGLAHELEGLREWCSWWGYEVKLLQI